MAQPSTIHRFRVELSDSDRGAFESLEFRAARHPSESGTYFAARVLAFCLNAGDGLEFTQGISDPEEPALRRRDPTGRVLLWIEIGFPDARKLHKASKTGAEVRVYMNRNPFHYLRALGEEKIHRKGEIRFFSFPEGFLEAVGRTLERDNAWTLTITGGALYFLSGAREAEGEALEHRLEG